MSNRIPNEDHYHHRRNRYNNRNNRHGNGNHNYHGPSNHMQTDVNGFHNYNNTYLDNRNDVDSRQKGNRDGKRKSENRLSDNSNIVNSRHVTS